MLKNILTLNGVKKLSQKEQELIKGGYACKLESDGTYSCPNGTYCDWDSMRCLQP
ncbi:hypothetical protein [Sinomicrobium pectinilyticum]|uniref:hypothetical protein n=1 Tax=Sinomicrobium pectinilyticum TaxID=1084421 RepID=UPI0014737E8E|nr:hypothetical protein [Sinomicrobium pectinilyticum]